jgi:hypothetical protein
MDRRTEWDQLRRQLEAMTADVIAEIRAYPAPIPACDAQFNRLLELRRLLPQEASRLEAASADPSGTIEDFVRASPCRSELQATIAQA